MTKVAEDVKDKLTGESMVLFKAALDNVTKLFEDRFSKYELTLTESQTRFKFLVESTEKREVTLTESQTRLKKLLEDTKKHELVLKETSTKVKQLL